MSDRRATEWSGEERMAAIIEYEKLSEEERGRFLREKGLHEVEIAGWKQAFLESLSAEGKRKRRSDPQQKRIRELEKELRRKEKALAEAAALLVLKKKGSSAESVGKTSRDSFPRKEKRLSQKAPAVPERLLKA